ncbi:conserved Plasmodium protein, unknown function [Plasmodium ovale]|uniref:Uncharacterized protein n=2 Tax=Plasmodium ovale TaxID=36330 RepID=A0A1A8VL31_PLAOA|nr:conserved Plasmodium protein, unknown function [Plasmodium ovale curtisi]SBS81004.1 conserved Plasmodium protein, unknown function [Plasmodium ovale curtisi]SCA48445.1 conserved Plasmodium protein, unknown function [Plasmodium ovale]
MVEVKLKTQNNSCQFHLNFNEIKLPDDVNILKDLEKEVENSIYHLKRSNEEIKQYDPDGKDKDLFLALNENKFSLNVKEERLLMIKEKIKIVESLNCFDHAQNTLNTDLLNNENKDIETDTVDKKNEETNKNVNVLEMKDLPNGTIDKKTQGGGETDPEKGTHGQESGIYL